MRLLLTSNGLANNSIAEAAVELVGKLPGDIQVGFVPTAINPEGGNKDWLIKDLFQLQSAGLRWVDIIDISAAAVDWRQRLAATDVVYVSGGNTFHLLNQARITGFGSWLQQSGLRDKVYIGSSAGSILVTPTIAVAASADDNITEIKDLRGLQLVDFEFLPHVSNFSSASMVEGYVQEAEHPLYAVDDQTAVLVKGKVVKVVSEGNWRLFPSR